MRVVDAGRRLIFKPTLIKAIGGSALCSFSFAPAGPGEPEQGKLLCSSCYFVGLNVYVLLFSGTLEMDSRTIIYRTPLAHYQIRWDEVRRIELDRVGSTMVFWGENKRLAALGSHYWQGADRVNMMLLVAAQMDKLGINMQQSEKAMFRLSKNTKVRASKQSD